MELADDEDRRHSRRQGRAGGGRRGGAAAEGREPEVGDGTGDGRRWRWLARTVGSGGGPAVGDREAWRRGPGVRQRREAGSRGGV